MFRYDVFFNFSFIRKKAQLIVQVLYHCTFAGGSGAWNACSMTFAMFDVMKREVTCVLELSTFITNFRLRLNTETSTR